MKIILKRITVKILTSFCQKHDLKFNLKNAAKQMKVPYCIIADFELYNDEKSQKKGKKTINVAEQNPFAYGF